MSGRNDNVPSYAETEAFVRQVMGHGPTADDLAAARAKEGVTLKTKSGLREVLEALSFLIGFKVGGLVFTLGGGALIANQTGMDDESAMLLAFFGFFGVLFLIRSLLSRLRWSEGWLS